MKKTIYLVVLSCFISACNALTLGVGAITKTSMVVAQERTPGNAIDDFSIWTQIKHLYLQKDTKELLSDVSVEVIEGRVHLTGDVSDPATRIAAVRLAWQPDGVKEVINEIEIGGQETFTQNIKVSAQDRWIKTQLASKLLVTKNIHSVNYSIEVVNGVVYLMGIAQDTYELNAVTNIASTIRNVKRVVSHVRLKSDPNRG